MVVVLPSRRAKYFHTPIVVFVHHSQTWEVASSFAEGAVNPDCGIVHHLVVVACAVNSAAFEFVVNAVVVLLVFQIFV